MMKFSSLRNKNIDLICIVSVLCLCTAFDISNVLHAKKLPALVEHLPGMVWIPAGEFLMGSASKLAKPNEQPVFKARVAGFWMDVTDVTNAQFSAFVRATGYITTAEQKPDWESLRVQLPPGTVKLDDALLVAGAMVFTGSSKPVPLDDWAQWWRYVPGANWRHPQGPDSNIDGKENYPVVQVSWLDAEAYAKWAGKRLATEVEWEYAARGGLAQADYVWGNEQKPQGKSMANIYADQGNFPVVESNFKTRIGTQAVKSYPANGYGLYDMTGNVWQWTADYYRADRFQQLSKAVSAENPAGPADSFDPESVPANAPKRVIRGGSFLCDESYCQSYRPSARRGADPSSPMSHIGFRLVLSSA
jgi:sulfatase modifying factor 1